MTETRCFRAGLAEMMTAHKAKLRERYAHCLGEYSTFKEARKNAREMARISDFWGYIKIGKGREGKTYIVLDADASDFDFYVHRDGRVCSVKNYQRAVAVHKKNLGMGVGPLPFAHPVRNRRSDEDKNAYKLEMAINK